MSKSILLCIIIIQSIIGFSQEDYTEIKNKYKTESVVILNKTRDITISFNKDQIKLHAVNESEKFYLSDKHHYAWDERIHYGFFVKLDNINAQLFIPSGNSYKSLKIEEIKSTADFGNSVFFDDSREQVISFPRIDKDYRSRVTWEESYTDPHFLGSFYFTSYLPMVKTHLSITFPSNVKLRYKIFNDSKNSIYFEEKKNKNSTTYTWTTNNVDKYKYQYSDFSISYFIPHVVLYIDEYTVKGKTIKVLSDLNSLYNWYYSNIKSIKEGDDSELKQLVDSLTRNISTKEEKIKNIYYWVQDHINYVAIENGYEGFIPKGADEVYKSRFGDCKGMSSILVKMIRMAGIDAYYTWVGTRDIPYKHSDVPLVSLHNHMIASVKKEDSGYYLLDATGKYLSLSQVSSFIQGKEVLIGLDEKKFEIYNVPVADLTENKVNDSIDVEIQTSNLKGIAQICYTGYDKYDLGSVLYVTNKGKHQEILKSVLSKNDDKFKLDSFNYKSERNRDSNLIIDYHFTIKDYVKSFDQSYFVNLHIDKVLYNESIDTLLYSYDKEISNKYINRSVVNLKIPDNYIIKSVPLDTEYKNPVFSFTVKYKKTETNVIMERIIYINDLRIKMADFGKWNEMIKLLNKTYLQSITLTKK